MTTFSGTVTSEATVADILDKGTGAVIVLDSKFHSLSASNSFFLMQHIYFWFIPFSSL